MKDVIRKVRSVNNTIVVSLPQTWLLDYNVNVGDYLHITVLEDGSLMFKKEGLVIP